MLLTLAGPSAMLPPAPPTPSSTLLDGHSQHSIVIPEFRVKRKSNVAFSKVAAAVDPPFLLVRFILVLSEASKRLARMPESATRDVVTYIPGRSQSAIEETNPKSPLPLSPTETV